MLFVVVVLSVLWRARAGNATTPKAVHLRPNRRLATDACGCTVGRSGWSSRVHRCMWGAYTSEEEAARCRDERAPSPATWQSPALAPPSLPDPVPAPLPAPTVFTPTPTPVPTLGASYDDCGCQVGLNGWSSTSGRCSPSSSTSPSEAQRCRNNGAQDPVPSPALAPQPVVDDCGCIVGQEGWSNTQRRCSPSSETDEEEAAACRQSTTCLCVFDIDRTLTGRQGDTRTCPHNRVLHNIYDDGYGGGDATLSQLSREGLSKTFCRNCYLGIVSAGHGSGAGSTWNEYILDNIMRSGPQDDLKSREHALKIWSYGTDVRSPYVLNMANRYKQDAVAGIRRWYADHGIAIRAANVYFFGDRTENIRPFIKQGFNSVEVSCKARDWSRGGGIGYCGATPSEIIRRNGNRLCNDGA